MPNEHIEELVRVADAITAFAVIQNVALAYGLAKREFKIRLDQKFCRMAALLGGLWNIGYIAGASWCSWTASTLREELALAGVEKHLMIGRAFAIFVFSTISTLLLVFYSNQRFWQPGVTTLTKRHPAKS